jgi:GldM N-terminal domain
MKSTYFHFIYCTIIAFLGYNYWSSVQAFKAFEHLNKQLNVDYRVLNENNLRIYREFNKLTRAYTTPLMIKFDDKTNKSVVATDSLAYFIDVKKDEFSKISGGLDTSKANSLINGTSNRPSKLFFTDDKINEIKDKLSSFSKMLIDSIENNKDRDIIMKAYSLPKLIADTRYWQLLKTLPASGALAELSCIKNQIQSDETAFLMYYSSRMTGIDMRFDAFKTAIAPKKAVLIEGESFEADIYLAAYSSSPYNLKVKVNGETLEAKQGVAHFKSKKETVGSKKIIAEASIQNPLTGQTTITQGYFEYQVLPKCSRDCQ